MNLPEAFQHYIKQHHLFSASDHLLVTVSGGIDSVVLCHLCHIGDFTFTVAHCNFSLRGAESDRDEDFVRRIGEKYGVPVMVKKFDTKTYAKEHKIATQEAARNLRYAWFHELLQDRDAARPLQYILTAHHLDDNVETVLMNFFKGTGISGLRGILPKNGTIIRPLLFATKKQLEAYAAEQRLEFVYDSSNSETTYTRNFFRHSVIPLVEAVYPQAVQNMGDAIDRYAEVELLYQQAIQQHKKKLLVIKDATVQIPVLKLWKTEPLRAVIYEIIKPYGFTHRQIDDVIKLLSSETGRYIVSASHRLLRNRKWLVISPLQPTSNDIIVIEKEAVDIMYHHHILKVKTFDKSLPPITADPNIALIDASALQYPLLLRKWRQGDYFYPLGMQKKKKLSRFFIDQKLSKIDKEEVWVIESHKRIVWVVGHRIDDRFKITPATKKAARFAISSL